MQRFAHTSQIEGIQPSIQFRDRNLEKLNGVEISSIKMQAAFIIRRRWSLANSDNSNVRLVVETGMRTKSSCASSIACSVPLAMEHVK